MQYMEREKCAGKEKEFSMSSCVFGFRRTQKESVTVLFHLLKEQRDNCHGHTSLTRRGLAASGQFMQPNHQLKLPRSQTPLPKSLMFSVSASAKNRKLTEIFKQMRKPPKAAQIAHLWDQLPSLRLSCLYFASTYRNCPVQFPISPLPDIDLH